MKDSNLLFTLSGIRGRAYRDLNFNTAKKIAIAFGLCLSGKEKKIILGRDTRPSGDIIEKGIIEGLNVLGFEIHNLGVCPTPVIIYTKNKLSIPAGIIITGSHKPQEWNGLKLMSRITYLGNDDLEIISNHLNNLDINNYKMDKPQPQDFVKNLNSTSDYIQDLLKYINYKKIKVKNNLRVVIDTGAGAGKFVTPKILKGLGCQVKDINNELLVNKEFPREIEPIKRNLTNLIMEVWQGKYDIGFAHDSDADRLAIIGDNGECFSEDIGLALITDYYLQKLKDKNIQVFFVTDLAASLRFEVIAEKFNAKVIRTPVGTRFLTEKMDELISNSSENQLVFGGKGLGGNIIFPDFNNTRDGIFTAVKIIEIMVETGKKISQLLSELPKYYFHQIEISINNLDIKSLITKIKTELINEGENVIQKKNDLRFGYEKDWFVLIHPSNTKQIIRIIGEAKRDSLARVYCETTAELIKLVVTNNNIL